MKKTNRGFLIYGEYKDSKRNKIRIQQSSSATEDAVWFFVENEKGEEAYVHMGQMHSVTAHLTKAQAKRVAKALLKFADGT